MDVPRAMLSRTRPTIRSFSVSTRTASDSSSSASDIALLLEQPTWSVASLLPKSDDTPQEDSELSVYQLRHLFRLSALPFPTDPEEQAAKIATLQTQLHFVRNVQNVDTTGLKPLQAIRDETKEGMKQYIIGLKEVEEALSQEESYGHNRRPRRRNGKIDTGDVENWDALATASRKAGRYIVVDGAEQ